MFSLTYGQEKIIVTVLAILLLGVYFIYEVNRQKKMAQALVKKFLGGYQQAQENVLEKVRQRECKSNIVIVAVLLVLIVLIYLVITSEKMRNATPPTWGQRKII